MCALFVALILPKRIIMLLDKLKSNEVKVYLNWKVLKNAYRQDKSEQQEFIQLCVSRSSSGPTDCAPFSPVM